MKNVAVFASLMLFSCLSLAQICGIYASDGYTAVRINGAGVATPYNRDVRIALQNLKSMTDSGYCRKGFYDCSIRGSDGYTAVYINGQPATSFNRNEQYAINAFNALKAASACRVVPVSCSLQPSDGYTAVVVGGQVGTAYTKNPVESINRLANLKRNGVCSDGQVIKPQVVHAPKTVAAAPKPVPQKAPALDAGSASYTGNLFCWKGYSQGQQNNNLGQCRAQANGAQTCVTNWNIHKQAVYDVCLQQRNVSKVVFCLKGYSQADQNKNLKQCRSQIDQGKQMCSTDWNVHKNAVYDVCIME